MAVTEANNTTLVIDVLRKYLNALQRCQQIKHPQHDFITWPMIQKFIQDINHIFNCGIVDLDETASVVAGVSGGSHEQQLQRSEDELLNRCARITEVNNGILTYLNIDH